MPWKDIEKRRKCQRDAQRRRRGTVMPEGVVRPYNKRLPPGVAFERNKRYVKKLRVFRELDKIVADQEIAREQKREEDRLWLEGEVGKGVEEEFLKLAPLARRVLRDALLEERWLEKKTVDTALAVTKLALAIEGQGKEKQEPEKTFEEILMEDTGGTTVK